MPIYELTYGYERVQFEPLSAEFRGQRHPRYVRITFHNTAPFQPPPTIIVIENARRLWSQLTKRGFTRPTPSG